MSQEKILICDDEQDLRELVGEYLTKRGFDVELACDGKELWHMFSKGMEFQAVLLDINMPGDDGLTILRRLRNEWNVAVILVTAADEQVDKIIGLEMGADDYITKPIDLRELEARLKAVIRRTAHVETTHQPAETEVPFGPFTLNLRNATISSADGENIEITAMEFQLLRAFYRHKGVVLSRDQLYEYAHDREWDPFDRSLDIRVSRLRRKLERDPTKPELIRTVRGIGYIYDAASE